MIHKDLLVEKSPYFEKCLKPNVTEGETLEVRLEEDRVLGFDRFVAWIYGGTVALIEPGAGSKCRRSAAEAWVLRYKWCMLEFQNRILDIFKDHHKETTVAATDLQYICELGLGDSKLSAYLFDQLASDLIHEREIQFAPAYPWHRDSLTALARKRPDVAVKLIEAVTDWCLANAEPPYDEEECKYHVHGPDYPACQS
jgi:hypothetical protein